MRAFVKEHAWLLFLILIFIISECLVNPFGNFPLNDDWSYGKSVLLFLKSGKIDIGAFPSMSLAAHLVWGAFFTKLFGFSFTVLRFSTLVASFTGIMVLNKLVFSITGSKLAGFVICLTLLFNPIYFNLSNTYMTDVNFNTVLIVICYFSFVFFKTKSTMAFSLVFIFSLVLILIRQTGLTVPLCFTFSCLFLERRRWIYTGFSLIFLLLTLAVFNAYESYLKAHLAPGAEYKFSGNIHLLRVEFWKLFQYLFTLRYDQALLHVLLYTFPFLITFYRSLLKNFHVALVLVVSLGLTTCALVVFKDTSFPGGNVFTNMSLGPETFFSRLIIAVGPAREPTYSANMAQAALFIKYCLLPVSAILCFLLLFTLLRGRFNLFKQPYLIFLAGLFFAHTAILFIAPSYFDRYHLPLITVLLVLFSFGSRFYKLSYKAAIFPLCVFFYISVSGTKDYLELNRKRWEAFAFLKNTLRVGTDKINGGAEVNCWNDGRQETSDLFNLENRDYLIEYKAQPGFRVLREYEFQRYFPFKKDKINIFVREHKTK